MFPLRECVGVYGYWAVTRGTVDGCKAVTVIRCLRAWCCNPIGIGLVAIGIRIYSISHCSDLFS